MVKKFACKDIGMQCDFTAKAKTEDELMQKISVHAKSAHSMAQIDAATMDKVKKAIKSSLF